MEAKQMFNNTKITEQEEDGSLTIPSLYPHLESHTGP